MVPVSFINKTKFSPLGVLLEDEDDNSTDKIWKMAEHGPAKRVPENIKKKTKKSTKENTREINVVENSVKQYVSVGKDKVTIDSGAGESVCVL